MQRDVLGQVGMEGSPFMRREEGKVEEKGGRVGLGGGEEGGCNSEVK